MVTQAIVRQQETQALARTDDELSVEDLVYQVQKIQQVMSSLMKEGEHFGVIPGTQTKPTLLKPGAEKLCLLFRLDPQYAVSKSWDGAHLTIESTCTLYHIPTGQRRGSGMGSCSTRESKYAYRKGARSCPKCKAETIIKGKAEYGGGWLCFAKKGGCGAKFKDGDQAIEGQNTDRVANPDIADTYNTVLKMANKRSLVAAVLNVTAASDIFMQDLEDLQVKSSEFEDAAERQGPPRMPVGDDDEPGREYQDNPEFMRRLRMVEQLIEAGNAKAARAALGSKADPGRPGSITAEISAAQREQQISLAYHKELGRFWQHLDRRLQKLEKQKVSVPVDDVVQAYIDPDDPLEDHEVAGVVSHG